MHKTYYIRDVVYGATDGIITTFAVVAGVAGAGLTINTILIVGFANLLADGFSMAASNYLGTESEHEAMRKDGVEHKIEMHHPMISGSYTLLAFVIAGTVPLAPFLIWGNGVSLGLVVSVTGLALFLVGATRSHFTGKRFLRSGLEILIIGGVAASIAYFVGAFVERIIG